MRTAITILLLSMLTCGYAWDLTDIDGHRHSSTTETGKVVLLVFGNTQCPPLDRLIIETIGPLVASRPGDVSAMVIFPECSDMNVAAWRARVPGASNVCAAVVSQLDPVCLDYWFTHGARYPTTVLLDRTGRESTNFVTFWPLSRLGDLQIRRGQLGPEISYRNDLGIPWRLVERPLGNHASTFHLQCP